MPHAYAEDQLVEQPAIGLFVELGWSTVSALEKTFGATGTLLRETKGEVVLVSRLRAALERLNAGRLGYHARPAEAITAIRLPSFSLGYSVHGPKNLTHITNPTKKAMKFNLTPRILAITAGMIITLGCLPATTFAQGTAFTYQGRLNDGASGANGNYDLRFALFDALTIGNQQGGVLTNTATPVSNGLFTVTLDFGNQFPGANRWLEFGVRTNGSGVFTTLVPRQPLTPTPYAIQAGNATTAISAGSAVNLSGVVANNTVGNGYATVGGGYANVSSNGFTTTVGGGYGNISSNSYATVSGGIGNFSGGQGAAVGGGEANFSLGNDSAISGGLHNNSSGDYSTIGGGRQNANSDSYTTVGGGYQNLNTASGGAVGGGIGNTNRGAWGVVGGGSGNSTGIGSASTVSGGEQNASTVTGATVGGGSQNISSGAYSTIAGGELNLSSGYASAVPGGLRASAAGDFSFAAGRNAKANHAGAFVWADSLNADFASTTNDQFCLRARGGVGIGTANPQGSLHIYSANNPTVMRLQSTGTPGFGRVEFVSNPQGDINEWRPGYIQSTDNGGFVGGLAFFVNGAGAGNRFGSNEVMRVVNGAVGIGTAAPVSALQVVGTVTATAFNPPSDRNLKENFAAVNPRQMLDKVAALPISRWNFIGDSATPHVGPMAQDFHAAFGLGTDERHIATVDADGVALAAIQGLNQKFEEQRAENAELKQQVAELKQLVLTLATKH